MLNLKRAISDMLTDVREAMKGGKGLWSWKEQRYDNPVTLSMTGRDTRNVSRGQNLEMKK